MLNDKYKVIPKAEISHPQNPKMDIPSSGFVLSEEIVKELKCSLCKKYLSFPPIYIISEDDSKYKCGRCTMKTRTNIRAIMYENLAKHMKFPCIYKSCTEKLLWADVQDHEEDCKYRTLTCIAPDCHDIILQTEIPVHFEEKHNSLFYRNKISRENLTSGMSMLENDGTCYLVLYDTDINDLKISVCSFEVPDKRMDIILNSKDSKHSIAVRDQNIIQFNEKYHCCKCLLGKCDIETHRYYKYHKSGMNKYAITKINKNFIRRTFGSCIVICNIHVTDEKNYPDDDLDDLLLSKDVVIDEVTDEEDRENVDDGLKCSSLKDLLICPTCSEPIASPIFQCSIGHSTCSSCKSKSETCFCGAKFENTRNYIIEEVLANLKVALQNSNVEANAALEKEIMCPLPRCFEKIKLDLISCHFRESHLEHYHFNKLSVDNIFGYYSVDVLVKDNKSYVVFFDFDDVTFGISMCSLEANQHFYEVQLIAENKKYSVTSSNQRVIMFNEKEHCFKCSIGVCRSSDHIFRTKKKEIFRRLTTKINRDCIRHAFKTNSINCNITLQDSRVGPNDKILRQLFECPICKDYMVSPIPQCVAGHTLCSVCKSKVDKCPSCEGKIDETRNYFLEKISDAIDLPCQYESESCTFRAGVKRMASHELQCPLKPKKECVETNFC